MDRRSWLWRRKSSEKTPGETESSGSISSPSDRFSDEQVNSTHSKQSPEITSKAATNEESTEKIKTLTEKLSAALLSINAKEEIVKQHSKVAEEAVTGWEKAEREVSGLKLQLDAVLKKNSALEDRVVHLDGALKECVRQLRQAREEQERKLEEVIAKRTNEWETIKSELQNEIIGLNFQLETAKSEAAASIDFLRPKLDASEKENKSLRLELVALSQKLEIRTLERDFSTKTAESASKQHLESIKKVAKLEAECRRLRSLNSNAYACVDPVSDNRSQTLEADMLKTSDVELYQSELRASSSEIILMDDFLEMEKLAAIPEKGNSALPSTNTNGKGENALKAELEDKIEELKAEKDKLEVALSESQARLEEANQQMKNTKERSFEVESRLSECQSQLKESDGLLKATKTELMRVQNQLIECQDQLRTSQAKLNAAENELIELHSQLIEREDQLNVSEAQLKDAEMKLNDLQNQLIERENLLNASQVQLKDAESTSSELRMQLNERENTIQGSQVQVKEMEAQLMEMQTHLSDYQSKLKASEGKLKDASDILVDLQAQLALKSRELQVSCAEQEEAALRVKALESETGSLLAKINSLVDENNKERALSAEAMAKCQRLEDELSRRDIQVDPHLLSPVICKAEKKVEEEKELAMAADKLAECQKTIASLGKQLKSLATLDDFLVDSDNPSEFSKESSVFFRTSELGNLPCVDCQ